MNHNRQQQNIQYLIMSKQYNQYPPSTNKNSIVRRSSYLTLTPVVKSSKGKLKHNPQVSPNDAYISNKLDQELFQNSRKRRARTIESERIQNLLEKKKNKQKYFQKLPYLIGSSNNKAEHILENQRYRYLKPTVNSVLYSKEKTQKKKRIPYKRICSVHCFHRNQTSPVKVKAPQKQQSNELRGYIYEKWKQQYDKNQISRYLLKMKKKKRQQEDHLKDRIFKTYLGIEQQFYELKTSYAANINMPQSNLIQNQHIPQRCIIPSIPRQQHIAAFIQDYQTFNKEINLKRLVQMPHFIVEYSPTQLYFGEMLQNSKEGVGILLKQRKCFQGVFRNNQKLQGIEISSSGVYKGTYFNGKRDGQGQFQWFNGEYYSGEWKDGHRHGDGIWTNKYGDNYNGSWIRGRGEGYGVYIAGEQQYKGDFVDFKKEGWGREKFGNGDLFEGTFRDGLPEGTGVYVWANGIKYQGQFRNGYRCGSGILKNTEGFVYSGQFIDEKPQGLCQIIMPNGDTYQGYIKNGHKHGRGILTLVQPSFVLDGQWVHDRFIETPPNYRTKIDSANNDY